MRIAYVCADRGVNAASWGGSATHVREMIKALAGRGAEITLFAASCEGTSDLPCRVVRFQETPAALQLRAQLTRAARRSPEHSAAVREAEALLLNQSLAMALSQLHPAPDLVYERQSLWCSAGLAFAQLHAIPHLLEVNAPLVEQQREYRELELATVAEAIESFLLSGSTRILVTSAALVDYARERGASRKAVRVVPCGAPASLLDGAVRAGGAARSAGARFTVGFLGSLKPWHGIEVLLRAFRKLHKADSCYRLRIVGDGPLREEIERYLRSNGLDAYSEVVGGVAPEAVAGELAKMDVGLAPYPALDFFYFSPLKLWEYAAAGVPIVASQIGDLPQIFPHRQAALFHPPGSATKLAAQITKLRDDPALAARLARQAREIARRHSWDRIAARVETIASDAAKKRSFRCERS